MLNNKISFVKQKCGDVTNDAIVKCLASKQIRIVTLLPVSS